MVTAGEYIVVHLCSLYPNAVNETGADLEALPIPRTTRRGPIPVISGFPAPKSTLPKKPKRFISWIRMMRRSTRSYGAKVPIEIYTEKIIAPQTLKTPVMPLIILNLRHIIN
jgi:hypothetical protein